jgi:hypothetical protein
METAVANAQRRADQYRHGAQQCGEEALRTLGEIVKDKLPDGDHGIF